MKDLRVEELKVQTKKVATQYVNDTETSNKARKKKKKSWQNWKKNQKSSTSATKVNTTDVLKQNRPKKSNPAKITCYYYNKKGHYANKYTKPKNRNSLSNFLVNDCS